ncbi:tryptophan synthase subunit alpha [Trueperella abortisuis]|uniref:Tryptophan synthase alpha chain n=1 Tax=Trueperella abortisuis TaxID=445930 RepID=A0ABT9PI95_9ACTO|nr:tryptophan synthase subunit alpha [Trueperella abortisuis]MDP9832436.1 tryptophan synthase alpha chain [Trueperella abortisuis]
MMYAADKIDQARAAGHAAFIAYLSAGYPDVDLSIEAARAVVDAGADVIEVGFPYSDPTMDGPIIQESGTKALERGLRRSDVFKMVEAVAESGAAALVMSYYNPIFRYGVDNFARDLANAGGAGLIIPDIIVEESGEWIEASNKYDLERIFLVAPSCTDERLRINAQAARGFVYAASRMGVTGLRATLSSDAESLVARTRAAGAKNVCVGIGVSTHDQAVEVAQFADGVIVGSAIIRALLENEGDREASLRRVREVATDIAIGAHTPREK